MKIRVRPDDLMTLGGELRQVAAMLRAVSARLGGAVNGLEWATGQKVEVEGQVASVRQQAEALAGQAELLAKFLATRAELFRSADGQGLGELGQALSVLATQVGTFLGKFMPGPDLAPWMNWGGLAAGALPMLNGAIRGQFPELFGPGVGAAVGGATGARSEEDAQAGDDMDVVQDAFWRSVGEAPVVNGAFSPQFAEWADAFNARVQRNWASKWSDSAGTQGAEALIATYTLTPEKVKQLWETAEQNHVDPRLLLAILQQEGTGSFNTNPANSAEFDGHGPQPTWSADLNAALDGPILSKLRLYPKAVEGGFPGTWVEWVNWYTPIDTPGFEGAPGVYAADINWAKGVSTAYQEISDSLGATAGDPVKEYGAWMSEHGELFQPKNISGDFVVKQGLPPGVDAPKLALWHEYPRPDYPETRLSGSFWWFKAPKEYCWYIEKR
ncbi:MAG: Peptidoglycan-binding domain 1 protein [Symbiobacteriaceae bacterium]|jgi:hypothetical protein|nr:Peptidoglycan-binding domain 1 protein [Symbiobacteriaceae bacterium]